MRVFHKKKSWIFVYVHVFMMFHDRSLIIFTLHSSFRRCFEYKFGYTSVRKQQQHHGLVMASPPNTLHHRTHGVQQSIPPLALAVPKDMPRQCGFDTNVRSPTQRPFRTQGIQQNRSLIVALICEGNWLSSTQALKFSSRTGP